MKTLLALTVLVLLCFLKHSSANVGLSLTMTMKDVECCEKISNKVHVPFRKVKHVVMTSGCYQEAIIVTTVDDRKVCLDPEWKHARAHLEEFKKKD